MHIHNIYANILKMINHVDVNIKLDYNQLN